VERQSSEQRLTNARNQLEKDKLTLGRIIGLPVEQSFTIVDSLSHPLTDMSYEKAAAEATSSRADLRSAEFSVRAAETALRAQKAQRLPVVSVSADYGGGGTNAGNFSPVYSVSGNISVPIYTGGRIHADIEQARSELARKEAEYADLKGRVAYDVKVAWLDRQASEAGVKVAERNQALAAKALSQSLDRYANGVTNYLEVAQAQEAVVAAGENYIASLYSLNLATVSFARAMGGAEERLYQLIGKTL
jgi:outer membrane protein TolC